MTVALVVAALPAFAQADRDDPLAWRRVDAGAPVVSVVAEDLGAGRTHRLAGRRLLLGAQEVYLTSADVADVFGARRTWQEAVQRLTLALPDLAVAVTAGSRLVQVGEEERLLPVPVLAAEGELWLPMILVTDVVAPRAGLSVRWDERVGRLERGTRDANVTAVHVDATAAATTVTIVCDEPLGFRAATPDPGAVEVKIYDGRLDPGAIALDAPRGLVQAVRGRQEPDFAVVTIAVADVAVRTRTEALDGGRRLVVTIEEQERLAALPEPVPRGQAHVSLEPAGLEASAQLRIDTVVIDAGHGGSDSGVVGPSGTREKDVNLAIAAALARHLRREGLRVVLTREDDRNLELAERAELANRAGGDLFVSLHCNGWFARDAAGLETYFLSPAKSDWSRSVEQAENQAAPADDVEFIVWELVQNRFIASSSELAEVVQREASSRLGLPDRGVKQAGFRVLVGAYMPAILVEVGFLSNPTEETLLAGDDYRQRVARALGDAILAYRGRTAAGSTSEPDEGDWR